jgi:hypothetical protein
LLLENREYSYISLIQHNQGISTFTARGIPWKLIHTFFVSDVNEARLLEKKKKPETGFIIT